MFTTRKSTLLFSSIAAASLLFQQSEALAASSLVEQRILTQEGLAIALASTVLQSQLEILVHSLETNKKCAVLTGNAGSVKTISSVGVSSTEAKAEVEVYFDTKCALPYIDAHTTVDADKSAYSVRETADYTGPTGKTLGTISVNESALFKNDHVEGVTGLGRFVPADGAVAVDLGLECVFPTKTTAPFPCSGGIAQNFPKLHEALASVTPLTLTLKKSDGSYSVSFAGTRSDMATGALDDLSITAPTKSSLGIGGHPKPYGTAVTEGSAGSFALFPPTPTSWTIVDSRNDAKFSIAVVDNKNRNSKGTVSEISTHKVLATFAVDQSGTGSITYSDNSKESITSWLLAD